MVTTNQKNIALQDLMRLAIDGNQNAYQEFLNEISKIFRAVAAKKVASADIEDVVQEILISVHKARHTYDFNRPLLPWLMSIANFRIIDYLRKHYSEMRHKTSDIEEFIDVLADVTNSTSNTELVDEMLAEFDEKQQKILKLLYVEEYSVKEVGKFIGMSDSAVKVAAHRAIKKIKQKFVK